LLASRRPRQGLSTAISCHVTSQPFVSPPLPPQDRLDLRESPTCPGCHLLTGLFCIPQSRISQSGGSPCAGCLSVRCLSVLRRLLCFLPCLPCSKHRRDSSPPRAPWACLDATLRLRCAFALKTTPSGRRRSEHLFRPGARCSSRCVYRAPRRAGYWRASPDESGPSRRLFCAALASVGLSMAQ